MTHAERTILLVEDNPDDEELTRMALGGAGLRHAITVARDGASALTYLFGSDEQPPMALPALVLLDLSLPRVHGFTVLERIRAMPRTARLPTVVLTSSDAAEDIGQCYALGANSYVRKPVEFEAFNKAVAQLGLYWLELNEPPRT